MARGRGGQGTQPRVLPRHLSTLPHLPSFLGPDGPVETDHLVTGMCQVAQRVVRILRKDDLGREKTGSNSAMGQAPLRRRNWGRRVPRYQGMHPSPAAPRCQGQSRQPQLTMGTRGSASSFSLLLTAWAMSRM